jgi:uncharacterized metal-binding protein
VLHLARELVDRPERRDEEDDERCDVDEEEAGERRGQLAERGQLAVAVGEAAAKRRPSAALGERVLFDVDGYPLSCVQACCQAVYGMQSFLPLPQAEIGVFQK